MGPLTQIKLIRFAVITLTATHPTAGVYKNLTFGVRWCGEDMTPHSNTVCTLPSNFSRPTLVCGTTLVEMCYHVFRLAFDYYTQVRGASCISATLRSSTLVSQGFNLPTHRSTRFASYSCDFTPFQTSTLTMLRSGWFPYGSDTILASPLR